jgi:hypothetical protein
MNCLNCRFWVPFEQPDLAFYGLCKRFPPSIKSSESWLAQLATSPATMAGDYCFEFKKKEDERCGK